MLVETLNGAIPSAIRWRNREPCLDISIPAEDCGSRMDRYQALTSKEIGMARCYDIITVGGGIAASSLAMAMAGQGARVLVLEREKQFKDRVRGEAVVPWGVSEANELGICRLLKQTCAHEVPHIEMGSGLRDLKATTPQQLPLLSFPHQAMQETLLAAAEDAGVEVRRGISVQHVEGGTQPAVLVNGSGL